MEQHISSAQSDRPLGTKAAGNINSSKIGVHQDNFGSKGSNQNGCSSVWEVGLSAARAKMQNHRACTPQSLVLLSWVQGNPPGLGRRQAGTKVLWF